MLRLGEGLFRNFESGSDYLEQVDELIAGLEARPTGLKELIATLVTTYMEIMRVIESASSDSDDAADQGEELREELRTLMDLLQCRDVTAHRRADASTVLRDTEVLMVRLAEVFCLREVGPADTCTHTARPVEGTVQPTRNRRRPA